VNISFTMHEFLKIGLTFMFLVLYMILDDDKIWQTKKYICIRCGCNQVR